MNNIRKPNTKPYLNRYTTLPVLLDILTHKKLVLLNPSTWEDRNDSYYMDRYKFDKKLMTVLALCFSKKRETFHHWKIFTGGTAGVCIEFDKELLLNHIKWVPGYRSKSVKYKYINDVITERPPINDWPFIKRKPFEDEGEFRIVYESDMVELPIKELSIKLSCIGKVTLSPWMPDSIADTVKTVISSIDGCNKLRVERSSLLETAKWKKAIDPIT